MYRSTGAAGGGTVGLLAATGYAGPTTILVIIGAAAVIIGALIVWRSMKLRPQPSAAARKRAGS